MNFWSTTLLLFISFMTATGWTQESEPLFCSFPTVAVCKQRHLDGTKREKRLRAVTDLMTKTVLFEVARDFLNRPDPGSFGKEQLESLEPKTFRDQAFDFFFQRLEILLRQYQIENQIPTELGFSRVRENLLRAIGKQDIPAKKKRRLLHTLKEIEFVPLSEPLRALLREKSNFEKFARECGWNGLEDNAFSDHWEEKKIVVICPGAMIASIEFSKHFKLPDALWTLPLTMTLGHETGHFFDSDSHPDLYAGMRGCLQKHYSWSFKKSVSEYMSELSADFWGTETLSEELKSLPSELREKLAVGAYEDLCQTPDDGVHPSGYFRIAFWNGRSAALREVLGCAKDNAKNCSALNRN